MCTLKKIIIDNPLNAKNSFHLNETTTKGEVDGSKSVCQRSKLFCTLFIDSIFCHFIVSEC